MEIDKKLNDIIAQQLDTATLEANKPAVMEDVVDTQEVSEKPVGKTSSLSTRSAELGDAVKRLTAIAKRYNFRPFIDAASEVNTRFSNLKSGVDLISN